jgi:hypothetical protein
MLAGMAHSFLRGALAGAAGALSLLVGCERIAQTPAADSPEAAAAEPERERASLTIINLADDFTAFYDATVGLPTAERVAAFKRDIASLFSEFYGVERYEGEVTQEEYDERITEAIESFGEIREEYIAKVERFGGDLDVNVASFLEAFPDFETDAEIHLLHSLGEMDGGTRMFGDKPHLIFGADGMVRYHSWENETPFFHHELFHLHHSRFFEECEENWCALWVEGLATLVSERMNPGAAPEELLLDFPPGLVAATEENLGASLAHLRTVLFSTESKDYRGLFTPQDDGTGLPGRRGYYLGLLVARELAKTHELGALSRISNEEVKPLLIATVDALAARTANEP